MSEPFPDSEGGLVFDLQRGSLNDGPGIRTTVFLKGCALRCSWCHNPESQSLRPELGYDSSKCISCLACVAACAQGVHTFNSSHEVNFSNCIASGQCVTACSVSALKIYGARRTVAEIMGEVVKDRTFFDSSGGGLTLSGGEPTLQQDFCVALLRSAKKAGIHTCVETCGASPLSHYEAVLPYVNLFLFDYKATDCDAHERLTGRPNEGILNTLHWLHARGASIILRCPLIPGVNDSEEELKGIAELSRKLPKLLGVELLPYHGMGEAKYLHTGRPLPSTPIHAPDEQRTKDWHNTLHAAGCLGLLN